MAYGRSRRPRRWAAWILLAAACRDPGSAPTSTAAGYVLDLDARPTDGFEGRGQQAWVDDVVARGLSHARWFRAEGEGTPLSARLRYEIQTLEDDTPVLRVHLVIQPDAALAAEFAALDLVLEAYVELERRDRTVEIRRDLPYAVERAVALADAKVTAVKGEPRDLAALTADPDPEVVVVALDAIRRRRLRELGGTVVTLLEHDEESVALAAMECLGVIGGPQHAADLLRAARLADRAYANRLYEALANLGGEQAHGFLAFAARNEEDPELAALAKQALARLDASATTVEVAALTDDGLARGHRQ